MPFKINALINLTKIISEITSLLADSYKLNFWLQSQSNPNMVKLLFHVAGYVHLS